MALLGFDGFDEYVDNVEMVESPRWAATNGNVRFSADGGGRFGMGRYMVIVTSSTFAEYFLENPNSTNEIILGYAVRGEATTAEVFVRADGGSNHITVRWNSDRSLSIYADGTTNLGTTAAGVGSLNTWIYVCLHVSLDDTTGGWAKLYVDGSLLLDITGVVTSTIASTPVSGVLFASGAAADLYYDDFYIMDSSGAVNNAPALDARVITVPANADGHQNDFTAVGAPSNWAAVADGNTSDGDTTHTFGTNPSERDMFGTATTNQAVGSVMGVQANVRCRKSDIGTQSAAPVIRSDGTDAEGATLSLTEGYGRLTMFEETDPATGNAWTVAAADAAEVGVEVKG